MILNQQGKIVTKIKFKSHLVIYSCPCYMQNTFRVLNVLGTILYLSKLKEESNKKIKQLEKLADEESLKEIGLL